MLNPLYAPATLSLCSPVVQRWAVSVQFLIYTEKSWIFSMRCVCESLISHCSHTETNTGKYWILWYQLKHLMRQFSWFWFNFSFTDWMFFFFEFGIQSGRNRRTRRKPTVLTTELSLASRDAWFGRCHRVVIRLICIMHPYSEGLWRVFLKHNHA